MTLYDNITSDIICILMLPIIPSQSILNVCSLVGLTALITVTLCMHDKQRNEGETTDDIKHILWL